MTMTPKEKAINLFNIFGKELAIKCVDEIINFNNALLFTEGSLAHQYWLDVKTELERMQ